jgi:hypothetical protein
MDRFQPQGLNFGPRGLFNFNPGTTQLNGGPGLGPYGSVVNSFAAFLIGATDQTGRTYMPITPTNRQTQFAAFFQDSYQVTRKLTLISACVMNTTLRLRRGTKAAHPTTTPPPTRC